MTERQRIRKGRLRKWIVEEEVITANIYELEATDEDDAENRYREDGERVRTEITDDSIIEIYPEDEEDYDE